MLCYNAECSAQHSLRECPQRVREPSPETSSISSLRENSATAVGKPAIASSQPELEEDPFGEGGGTGSVTYPSLVTSTVKVTEKDPSPNLPYQVESPTIPSSIPEEGEDDLDALEAMKEAEANEDDECHCLPYVYGEDGEHVVGIDDSICYCGWRDRNRERYGCLWGCFDPEEW
jgi:hypothetical protein